MEDTTTTTPALPPRAEHVLRLAQIIRELGVCITSHGEAALAEAILKHPGFSGCHDGPAIPTASPAEEERMRFVTWLRSHSSQCVELGRPDWAHMADRAADMLEGFSRDGSAAPTVEQSTPPPLPPGYIDPEHQGEDRKLLEAFYQGARLDSGTADEIVLRGIRRVLALRPTVGAVRAADAAIAEVALEAEFRAWWNAKVHIPSADYRARHACATHVAWGRHLLSRVEP